MCDSMPSVVTAVGRVVSRHLRALDGNAAGKIQCDTSDACCFRGYAEVFPGLLVPRLQGRKWSSVKLNDDPGRALSADLLRNRSCTAAG